MDFLDPGSRGQQLYELGEAHLEALPGSLVRTNVRTRAKADEPTSLFDRAESGFGVRAEPSFFANSLFFWFVLGGPEGEATGFRPIWAFSCFGHHFW